MIFFKIARLYNEVYDWAARLYGVQEAVSSTLATRTKDGCQGQQERQIRKDLALFVFYGFNRGNACSKPLAMERLRRMSRWP